MLAGLSSLRLAEELARRIESQPGNPCHDVFYKHGFHLLRKHFYLPIPDDTDNLEEFWSQPSKMVGVNIDDGAALNLMEIVCPPYLKEFRARFPIDGPLDPPDFYLINGGYMAIDAHIYYCLIRHFKPRKIVEIGNGNSTLLAIAASDANKDENGQRPHLTSIDPYPWPLFKDGYEGLDSLVVKRVQDVSVSYFELLEAGDILFIDSSHVIRSGNDVHYEFLEILPRLKPGVLIHVHDISLPRPYPKVYFENHLYWTEQYLLQAFLCFNDRFEVVWPGNYMMINYPDRVISVFPEFERMRKDYPMSEPTGFWMRVKSSD
ncbi:MAG: class I SAM-dependent methyltransferase [Glaciimonas sp.]|nr:class I SAM-dependent methyltransferase [Glaciimonas sp.]